MILKAFTNKIYPRKVFLVIVETSKDIAQLAKMFTAFKIVSGMDKEFSEDEFYSLVSRNYNGDTTAQCWPVYCNDDKKLGILCIVYQPSEANNSTYAHEAVHIADYFFEELGLIGQDFTDGDEHYAYLVGWIVSCFDEIFDIYNNKKKSK